MSELTIQSPRNNLEVIEQIKDNFLSVSKDQKIKWESELGFAMQHIQGNDFLNKIAWNNQQSLRNAIINVSAIGISLNPASKHAYLVPRKGVVCLDISYMGLIHLACSTGSIVWGQAKVVRHNDTYRNMGIDKAPEHIVNNSFGGEELRGPVIGAYCTVKTSDGDYLTEEMDIKEILDIRDRSELYKRKQSGPWATDEGQMIRKTVVKRASSYWPKVERFDDAINMLNTESGEGIDFDKEQEPKKIDGTTRIGRNPNYLPPVLKNVYLRAREALDCEDMDVLKEVFFSFGEEEERIAVWKCFDSKERGKIGSYMSANGIDEMNQEKRDTAKEFYLDEKGLEILIDYNWNGRQSALPDAPEIK